MGWIYLISITLYVPYMAYHPWFRDLYCTVGHILHFHTSHWGLFHDCSIGLGSGGQNKALGFLFMFFKPLPTGTCGLVRQTLLLGRKSTPSTGSDVAMRRWAWSALVLAGSYVSTKRPNKCHDPKFLSLNCIKMIPLILFYCQWF